MTSQEAVSGFQRLRERLGNGRSYTRAELSPIWMDLLGCSVDAFEKAIGIMLMHGKFLPAPDYVLQQTRQWDIRLRSGVKVSRGSVEDLGNESLRLTRGYLDGTLAVRDYIAGLYLLSEQTGNVEYAEEARRKEGRLVNEGGHDAATA